MEEMKERSKMRRRKKEGGRKEGRKMMAWRKEWK
jgi:hypothetical protein